MKRGGFANGCLMSMLALWALPVCALPGIDLTDFQKAYDKGAWARVEFRIVDDVGDPVKDAVVNVFFDMADRSKGRRVITQTDANGVCAVEGKTKGALEIEVSREGYYRSNDFVSFISMGHEHEVKGSKWQPWGMARKIVLLPIKNPQARIANAPEWKRTMELQKWIGFDLMKYDFVKPYGIGTASDVEVMFDWDGLWHNKEYKGMALKMRFTEKYAGGYYATKTHGSEYIGIYTANTNEDYKTEFSYSERVAGRDKRGNVIGYERELFDPSKVLVIRSRCKLNEDGTLKAANYFQICHVQFAGGKRGAALKFLSIYNPTSNDTNLEPKKPRQPEEGSLQ